MHTSRPMSIALDIAYGAALAVTSPVWVYRMIRHGRYRADWSQRLGGVPNCYGIQPTVWIHGVSLGEINAARGLVDELHVQLPDFRVVISSTTATGITAAKKHFAPGHVVFRWPMDFSLSVARALGRVRPNLVVLMEGEAWPNFLAACNRRDIPVVVVNGRMSPNKGYPRYKMLGRFAAKLFNRLTAIGVQDETYADKFVELGMDRSKVHLTGMMKFDSVEVTDVLPNQEALQSALGLGDEPLLVAGGTGPGEESLLLDVYKALHESHPALRLAIVPRKPERFDEVARLIEAAGFGCVRRSQRPDGQAGVLGQNDVILGDTMGELRTFYALASVVFVGRSLVPMGGSDMIEAAALGKATCFGPHTFNFPQAEGLVRHGAVCVKDPAALREQIIAWRNNPAAAKQAGAEVQQYVKSQQGATRRNVELLCHVLGRAPALVPGDVATEKLQN
jgi:3-deoxy-D-manno-octulosonic-acid transferase